VHLIPTGGGQVGDEHIIIGHNLSHVLILHIIKDVSIFLAVIHTCHRNGHPL
jgi:hypothetical protein